MNVETAYPDDADLIARVLAGDRTAFTELVHAYTSRVYSIGWSMLRNEQDARDVVQETFLNVYRRLSTFRGEASLASWISRIATNSALMRLRRRRRKPESSLDAGPSEQFEQEPLVRNIVDRRPLADQVHLDDELGRRIRAAVEDLPDTHREVLILADYRELPMRDIADALDISVANVKTRLHRARLAVRASLADYLAGAE